MKTMTTVERRSRILEIESALDTLLDGDVGYDFPCASDVYTLLGRARKLVRALTRFPRFDTSILAQMKAIDFEFNSDKKVHLFVPVFGCVPFGLSKDFTLGWCPTAYCHELGPSYDQALLGANDQAIRQAGLYNGMDTMLHARVPVVPKLVTERVEAVIHDFDRTFLAWEAEWKLAPVADPLVIGTIGDHAFLLEHYNMTKVEDYVSREFTTPPTEA